MDLIALLKFTLICIEFLAWPVLGLVYPLFASVRAIESNSKNQLRKLVIYWTVFSLISLFEFAFVKIIEWIPFWSNIKLVVTFWLVMPEFYGANIAYQSFVRRWLLLNLQQVSNRFNKPNKEKLHNIETTFLDVADKYIKENGYEALEKLISIKRDCQVADNSQRDILVLESALDRKLKEPFAPQKCDQVEEATEKSASTEAKQVQKGKDAAAAEIKDVTPPSPPPQEIRQEWACILCEVKTSSETTLNAHLHGKKHKSMLESLKRNQGQKEANKNKAGEGSRKKTEERVEKNVELWCNVCKVKFPSEIHKAAHMKGKRHSAKLAAGISSL